MKNKTYLLNTLLAEIVALALLAAVLVKTYQPAAILPQLSIPNLVLVSLVALLADHFLAPNAPRCYICIPVFSALTFLLLPLASGLVGGMALVKLAVGGCVVFTAVTWLFSAMVDRMSSGHNTRLAAVISALGIFLASQAFAGILL